MLSKLKNFLLKHRNVIIIISFIISSFLIWLFYIFLPNSPARAGQLGDSFGFFNFIAMLIVAFTLIFQIREFISNRKIQNETNKISKTLFELQLDFNYHMEIHKDNVEEINSFKKLHREYFVKFMELSIAEKKGKLLPGVNSTSMVHLIKMIFLEPLYKFKYRLNLQFGREIEIPDFREKKSEEQFIDYGLEILNTIEDLLIEIDKIIYDEYNKYIKSIRDILNKQK